MKTDNDISSRQLKINGDIVTGVSGLQRKFKLTFEMAQTVINVLKELKLDQKWHDPKDRLPDLMTPVIVEGICFRAGHVANKEIFIAILHANSGWVKKDTLEPLYVHKWMEIPKNANED